MKIMVTNRHKEIRRERYDEIDKQARGSMPNRLSVTGKEGCATSKENLAIQSLNKLLLST